MTRNLSSRVYHDGRIADDGEVLYVEHDITPEQGAAFVAGELDRCGGCDSLAPAFTGPHCADCEAYCLEHYGPCVKCGQQGYAMWVGLGDLCMPCYGKATATEIERDGLGF